MFALRSTSVCPSFLRARWSLVAMVATQCCWFASKEKKVVCVFVYLCICFLTEIVQRLVYLVLFTIDHSVVYNQSPLQATASTVAVQWSSSWNVMTHSWLVNVLSHLHALIVSFLIWLQLICALVQLKSVSLCSCLCAIIHILVDFHRKVEYWTAAMEVRLLSWKSDCWYFLISININIPKSPTPTSGSTM